MTALPKRLWFRFSLRTLFVLVTIFGVWLGWNAHIVQQRKAILSELRQIAGKDGFLYDTIEKHEASIYRTPPRGHYAGDPRRVSFIRRLFGDESYLEIYISPPIDLRLMEQVETAFPEADLHALEHEDSPFSGFLDLKKYHAFRDSLIGPAAKRQPNEGTLFKTGLIEKPR